MKPKKQPKDQITLKRLPIGAENGGHVFIAKAVGQKNLCLIPEDVLDRIVAAAVNTSPDLAQVRTALADYMYAEGCSCCRDTEKHDEAAARLAKLLSVPAYSDGSGYDFSLYRSECT